MWALAAWLCVAGAGARAQEQHARDYTAHSFKQQLRDLDGNFVLFYAPWCSHCTVFQPIWNQLAEMINTEDSRYAIAQVDCTVESNLCRENDITGYPTLLYFKKNSLEPSEYRGTRDLPSLTLFMNEVITSADTLKHIIPDKNENEVKIYKGMGYLSDQNFEKFVSKGQHFIMFYAPWCGVSQSLAPTWAVLAEEYEQNSSVKISKIDCMEHHAACLNFDVKDYPHLLWMVNGKVMLVKTKIPHEILRKMLVTRKEVLNSYGDVLTASKSVSGEIASVVGYLMSPKHLQLYVTTNKYGILDAINKWFSLKCTGIENLCYPETQNVVRGSCPLNFGVTEREGMVPCTIKLTPQDWSKIKLYIEICDALGGCKMYTYLRPFVWCDVICDEIVTQ